MKEINETNLISIEMSAVAMTIKSYQLRSSRQVRAQLVMDPPVILINLMC